MVKRLVSIDTADNQMPDVVRSRVAANITNPEMVEGAAVAEAATAATVAPSLDVERDRLGRVSGVNQNGADITYTRDRLGRINSYTVGTTTRTVTRNRLGQIEEIA